MEKLANVYMVEVSTAPKVVDINMRKIALLGFVLLMIISACGKNDHQQRQRYYLETDEISESNENPDAIDAANILNKLPESNNYHTDTQYKYEYRTGYSGDYTYNYDMEDTSDSSITANCTMSGKYGSCEIEDGNGDTLVGEAEWVSYDLMQVTDENGAVYEMETQ